jgi:hypothetical protein
VRGPPPCFVWGERHSIFGSFKPSFLLASNFNVSEALHYCLEAQLILFINVSWFIQGLGEEVDNRRQIAIKCWLDKLATMTFTPLCRLISDNNHNAADDDELSTALITADFLLSLALY